MKYIFVLILICCLLLGSLLVKAQSGGSYELTWRTINSGSGLSSGSAYSMYSTLGQPNVGETSGGDYNLQAGFWPATPAGEGLFFIYLPMVLR